MSLAWPAGPFRYAWTPHGHMVHLLPPVDLPVWAENGERARVCVALLTILAVRKTA